jgi:hypothetical protein
MTTRANTIRLFRHIAVLFLLFLPVVTHAESDKMTMEQAQAMELGIFLGGAATQYDQCVAKGYISSGDQKAEDLLKVYLKKSEQKALDEKAKDRFVYVQKGWDMLKQKFTEAEVPPQYWEDNCARINKQWKKYLDIISKE